MPIGDNVKRQNYALVYEPVRLEDNVSRPAAVLANDLCSVGCPRGNRMGGPTGERLQPEASGRIAMSPDWRTLP
jgi:hypothetical protein